MAWPWPINGVALVNAIAFGRNVEVTRDVRFAEGRRGLLDVYAPRNATEAPLVVFFYGGGWEDGNKADYRFAAMALAKRGIVTVVPDYRLYPDVRFPTSSPTGPGRSAGRDATPRSSAPIPA